jgi:superfamily I DNA/RNA helicase
MNPIIYVGRDFMFAKSRLPKEINNLVDAFFPKFQTNSRSKAINFEKIKTFKDKSFKSVRINHEYRAIISHPNKGNNFYMLWVDKHDEAYAWAENKYFEWNNNVHCWQLYRKDEPQKLIPNNDEEKKLKKDFKHPYGITIQDLKQLGVPNSELSRTLEIISLDILESRKDFLPESAYEKIYLIFNGVNKIELLEQVKEGKSESEEIEEQMLSPNNLQQFIPLTDDEDLKQFISGNLTDWQFFLHPEQTKLIKKKFNGPVKVTGGAGTGKTVTALHRFRELVKTGLPNGNRMLFCTYTNSLAKNIKAIIEKLSLSHRGCYDILTIHGVAHKLASNIPLISKSIEKDFLSDESLLNKEKIKERNIEIWANLLEDTILTAEFAEEEYQKVILFHQIESLAEYLVIQRTGRENRISKEMKEIFWYTHLEYKKLKREKFKFEWDELYYELISCIKKQEFIKPYAHIILDELQDLSNIELRFLRYIVNPGINDLFMVGDPLQKVYDRNINFSSLRIQTRGRSKRLLRNYRTTEEIRKDAVKIITNEEFSNFEESKEKLDGYFSMGNGPEPSYLHFKSLTAEIQFVENKIKELIDTGLFLPEDICIAAKRNDDIQKFHSHFHNGDYKIRKIEKNNELSLPEHLSTSTFHSLKGLEFKIIFLVGLNANTFLKPRPYPSDEEKKEAEKRDKALLYVAMTRAKMLLYISGNGSKSSILQKTYPYKLID